MLHFLQSVWPYLIVALDILFAVAVTIHAVLRKPETSTVIAWVGLAWLAPFLGAIIYVCFGINRIKRKAVSLEIGEGLRNDPSHYEEHDLWLRDELLERCPTLPGLSKLGGEVTGKAILPGNAIVLLRDGDGAFPAMLEAIAQAKQSIALLSYIFDSDRVGEPFLKALKEAQARGVEVRVLIDHVGSRYSKPSMATLLREEGVPVATFLPTRTPLLFQYANLRNHRKILVVDGRIGFTGGTNIREGHSLDLDPRPKVPVQCAHFRLEGPVVAHLQEVFAIDWAFACEEVLRGDLWFPKIERSGGTVGARGVSDGPDEDYENMSEVILGALSTASVSVRIASPYFLPDSPVLRALNVAARRGVQVDIVLPSDNNMPLVDWASTALLAQLLEKGCRIH
jgi:cardiolipin synthase